MALFFGALLALIMLLGEWLRRWLSIILAVATNNLVKAGLAGAFGTRHTGWRVAVPMLASLAIGLATVRATLL